jgi:hypothetical protein
MVEGPSNTDIQLMFIMSSHLLYKVFGEPISSLRDDRALFGPKAKGRSVNMATAHQ